ncbi:MAG: hypothetical protein ABI847_14885 [Anaerolineales bacterium]
MSSWPTRTSLLAVGHQRAILFVLLPLFVSLACQGARPAAPATPTAAAPATSTTPAGPTSPTATAAPARPVFGSGPLIVTDTTVGLADLSGYTGTLTYAFAGTRAGKAEQWTKTYTMLHTQDPASRLLTIATTGTDSETAAVFMAEVNGVTYQRNGPNECTASVLAPGDSLIDWLEPASILNSVIGADKAGSETVNGVPADHYTFDERALGGLGIAKSTGELWLATPGGYLVKYVLATKGEENAFGPGVVGTLTWDYELTGANQPTAIQLPPDCPAGFVDAPLLPDAANIRKLPSLLTYDTASSLAEAAAFYQNEIPGLGWTVLNAPVTTDTTVYFDFAQGDQILTVILTAADGRTKVDIELDSGQP